MSGPRATGAGLLLLGVLLLVSAPAGAKEQESLPSLRRALLEAHDAEGIAGALHALAQKIGVTGYWPDHGAFADWLGTVPDGRADHPLVRRHRGWALVRAKRGEEAIPHLEAALKDDPSDGLTRAWLADALRLSGRFLDAADMLVTAVRCGLRDAYVDETITAIVLGARRAQIAGHAETLPDYVQAARRFVAVQPSPMLHAVVAAALAEDFRVFERPERTRGKLWARALGEHTLEALERSQTVPLGSARLAHQAAQALEVLDRESGGRTLRFDLLSWAYRLGADPNGGAHTAPPVLTQLAEAAAREGRYGLAWRLAQERLEISYSPRAKRLLMRLPPDLGREE